MEPYSLLPDLFGHPLPGEPATEDPAVVDRRPASGTSDTVVVRWESHRNPSLRKSACWIAPERDHTVMRREYEAALKRMTAIAHEEMLRDPSKRLTGTQI